mmetsp:Transcript_139061/g.432641  ORF Transcript_139061/g.432641 Transcript_139061/m.432641 type:complete len:349 (-) Transcript_139061:305-1351(-)
MEQDLPTASGLHRARAPERRRPPEKIMPFLASTCCTSAHRLQQELHDVAGAGEPLRRAEASAPNLEDSKRPTRGAEAAQIAWPRGSLDDPPEQAQAAAGLLARVQQQHPQRRAWFQGRQHHEILEDLEQRLTAVPLRVLQAAAERVLHERHERQRHGEHVGVLREQQLRPLHSLLVVRPRLEVEACLLEGRVLTPRRLLHSDGNGQRGYADAACHGRPLQQPTVLQRRLPGRHHEHDGVRAGRARQEGPDGLGPTARAQQEDLPARDGAEAQCQVRRCVACVVCAGLDVGSQRDLLSKAVEHTAIRDAFMRQYEHGQRPLVRRRDRQPPVPPTPSYRPPRLGFLRWLA